MKSALFLCFSLFWVPVSFSEELPRFSSNLDPHVLADTLVGAMDRSEIIGQTLMFGYPSANPDRNIISWIAQGNLGSVRISGANASSLKQLSETISFYRKTALSAKFGIPLLIATDQEGGIVRHIKDITATPGNTALAADPIPGDSLKIGRIIGQELIALGINMNFAPVIDVFSNPRSEVIGSRAFSDNPYWTGILGLAFAKGQQEFGVISTAKHYPGHGDTDKDSHGTLPIINSSKTALLQRDLIPYKIMIRGGVPAIMVGHLAFPNITGDSSPASLSRILLTDLLREDLGFSGLIVTDDLFMRGARINNAPLHEIAYRSILAGADLLLISQGPQAYKNIMERFKREMSSDPEFNNRVHDAAVRVVTMKAQWLKKPPGNPEYSDKEETKAFLLNHAARSITLIRDHLFPIKSEDAGRVLLVGNYIHFFTEGLSRYPNANTWQLEYSESRADIQQSGRKLAATAQYYDTIIALLPDFNTAILLNELKSLADRIIVMSILSPSSLEDIPWVKTALALYGTGQDSFTAAFAALNGDFHPEGQLPVSLDFAP